LPFAPSTATLQLINLLYLATYRKKNLYYTMSGIAKEGLNRFYKDFQRICKQWPVDSTKSGGRDFGEHLRKTYDVRFKDGDYFEVI